MTPTPEGEYEKEVVEAARLFALHSDCPHWMDDDHYCRRCEDAGRFIPLIKSRDILVAARARKAAFEEMGVIASKHAHLPAESSEHLGYQAAMDWVSDECKAKAKEAK
jgi:hypothetical protein